MDKLVLSGDMKVIETDKMGRALFALNQHIDGGQEFPEALWEVSNNYGVDYQAFKEAYDAQ
jgi:hypothetical protein